MRRPRHGSNGEASEEDAAEEPALEKLTAEDLWRSRGGAHGGGVGARRRRERQRKKKEQSITLHNRWQAGNFLELADHIAGHSTSSPAVKIELHKSDHVTLFGWLLGFGWKLRL